MKEQKNNRKRLGRPLQSSTCRRVPLKEIQKRIAPDGLVFANQTWLDNVGVKYQTK